MERRTTLTGALTAGAIVFTLNAGLSLAIIVADAVQWLQASQRAGSGSTSPDLFHLPLMLLMAAAVSAFPVGLWGASSVAAPLPSAFL